jgi:hypothetical protein
MQIKIYLLFLLTLTSISIKSNAQELFPKKELYHIWVLADEKLDAGLFDDALRLYNTHADNPSFSMKVRQIARLKEITSDADKLKKRGQYAEAVEKYKEYRKLKDIGSLAIFEKKIEECLNQINKAKLTELTAQQRIITGFEFTHRGREKLSRLDTAGAKRDFNNAKILGGNRNNILKEQYIEGIRITNELTKWGKDNLARISTDHNAELATLESYRSIRNIDIPDIELRIKELKTGIAGNNSLAAIAKLCDTELLIKYVNTNKHSITTSTFLISRLNEFSSTQKKIAILKQDNINSETVKSAYQSLISWTDDLPAEIQSEMKNCIQNEYAAYISALPNQQAADRVPETIKEKCEGEEDFKRGILLIRKELASCNLIRAQSLWKTTSSYITNCYNKEALLKEKQALRDSISNMARVDSILNVYRGQIRKLKDLSECAKIEKIYQQMNMLPVCDKEQLALEIKNGLSENENCRKNTWWKLDLIGNVGRTTPKYKVGNSSEQMDDGWMKSAGLQISYIDNDNPFDFLAGLEYFSIDYYSLGTSGSIKESFVINGANAFFNIKLHTKNNRERLRPYLKFGPEVMIPVTYEYKNHFNSSGVSSTNELQRTVFSATGAVGMEIQKKNFGAFAEGYYNYGLGNLYNSSLSHITTTNEKVDARLIKYGLRIGIRLW